MTLHTYYPNQCPYQVSPSYTLRLPRYSPDKILQVKVTMTRSKVKSRLYHDVAHLQLLINFPTKYQLPTPYGFRDIAQTRFYRSRSLRPGQSSNQGHTMTLHTYTPNQYPYQVSTSYILRFLRYSPDKIFKLKVTTARSKVKSRSDHDVYLHLPNVPTKYQLPTSLGYFGFELVMPPPQEICFSDITGKSITPRAFKFGKFGIWVWALFVSDCDLPFQGH